MVHRFHPDSLPPGSVHSYLPDNHRLAGRLLGRRLRTVARLLDVPAEAEPRLEYGPALLTGEEGEQWLVDTEESKANLRFLPDVARTLANSSWYSGMTIRAPIAEPAPGHPLRYLVTEPITSVEVISREPEPGVPDSFAMCGLRLTTAGGAQICLGTHLTDLRISELAFRTPSEVDPGLCYAPL